jgi:hypothetical protein
MVRGWFSGPPAKLSISDLKEIHKYTVNLMKLVQQRMDATDPEKITEATVQLYTLEASNNVTNLNNFFEKLALPPTQAAPGVAILQLPTGADAEDESESP